MTPATAFLKAKQVLFSEHTYGYVEHGGTEVPAKALGIEEHHIVKTLVMEDEARKPLVVLMHGDRKVSTGTWRARPGANRSRLASRRWRSATPATRLAAPRLSA
jgi:prolyl-tRNA editing enzyme YbaK/EbsC (Cys-tRNA(Pro) deacylase)